MPQHSKFWPPGTTQMYLYFHSFLRFPPHLHPNLPLSTLVLVCMFSIGNGLLGLFKALGFDIETLTATHLHPFQPYIAWSDSDNDARDMWSHVWPSLFLKAGSFLLMTQHPSAIFQKTVSKIWGHDFPIHRFLGGIFHGEPGSRIFRKTVSWQQRLGKNYSVFPQGGVWTPCYVFDQCSTHQTDCPFAGPSIVWLKWKSFAHLIGGFNPSEKY